MRWSAGTTRERPGYFKPTPIMIDGVLYTSTPFSEVAAIDAASGTTLWTFDPRAYTVGRRPANSGWQHRGVAYWSGKVGGRTEQRIVIATGIGELIALNARSGQPIASFGKDGRVDLQAALIRKEEDRRFVGFNAPPMIVGNSIVVGCTVFDRPTAPQMPAGHIQAFDVVSGAPKWIFHTVPQGTERGVETWQNDSWKYSGNTNAWPPFSADPELGLVYIPVGTPTNDYYGGDRKGNNLYAESLLAIAADSGKLVWHFQGVHHGLWDYDFPAAPTLVDIKVDGRRIKAVAQVSKQGFTYVFDRATGKPVWPIEERPVPQSTVPGEQTSPTQPFPTKPPPFARQGLTTDDLIDFTPELRAEALQIVADYTLGPLFTPPSVVGENGKKGVLQMPSAAGGANWGGAGFDPETGYLFLQSANIVSLAAVVKGDGTQTPAYAIRGAGRSARPPRPAAHQAAVRRGDCHRSERGRDRVAGRAWRRTARSSGSESLAAAAARRIQPHVPVERRTARDEVAAVPEPGADEGGPVALGNRILHARVRQEDRRRRVGTSHDGAAVRYADDILARRPSVHRRGNGRCRHAWATGRIRTAGRQTWRVRRCAEQTS